jgi:phosphoserine phosphatase RsbU/P
VTASPGQQPGDPPTRITPPVVVPAETAEDLYEHAPCGYLSALPDGRIVRINQTLLDWLGHRREDLVGLRRFADLLTAGGRIYHETHYAPLLAMQGSAREIALDLVRADGTRLPVLVNSVAVTTRDGARVIRTSVFDATDRRSYERELVRARERAEASEARARLLARTLQASLMPPSIPAIPGLDVAAAYRPAGRGDEVGGDFYDVFQTGPGTWGVVLGDVCGKGPQAAAVTALCRYAVRAAAMGSSSPAEVLSTLNATLLGHEADRFATVVYLAVRPSARGAEVVAASGGHPLPLLLSGAEVAPIGAPGDLLGILEAVELHDVALDLGPGDRLLCFTDGLTEARRGDEQLGDERLTDIVSGHAPRSAPDLVAAVVEDVLAFSDGQPKDDMAAVLLGVPRSAR